MKIRNKYSFILVLFSLITSYYCFSNNPLHLCINKEYSPSFQEFAQEILSYNNNMYMNLKNNCGRPCFIQAEEIQNKSKIVIIGDQHADFELTCNIFSQLRSTGFLNQNYDIPDNQNNYIVCLGDYIDKNHYAKELLFFLLKVKNRNFKNVFLLKGNHEELWLNRHIYHDVKRMPSFWRDLNNSGIGINENLFADFYNQLPSALYLGINNSSSLTNCIQFSHGGLEPGIKLDLTQLFMNHFTIIDSIDREKAFFELFPEIKSKISRILRSTNPDEKAIKRMQDFNENILYTKFAKNFAEKSFFPSQLLYSGFLDEQFENFEIGIIPHLLSILYGKKYTEQIIHMHDNESYKVLSIFRGHQHQDHPNTQMMFDNNCTGNGKNEMLSKLKEKKGYVKQWNGLVNTVVATPQATDKHSFLILTMAKKPCDWKVEHFYKKPESENFTVFETKLFS